MATVKSSTLIYLIHNLLRYPKPVCLFLRPFSISVLIPKSNHHDDRRFPFFFPSISSSLPLPRLSQSFSSAGEYEDNVSSVSLSENQVDGSDLRVVSMRESGRGSEVSEEMMIMTQISALNLSVKEKKKLPSYAHSLGDKLKCQLVGKSGVTDSVVLSFLETLEKIELLKVKIHKTCPGEIRDMILHLEEATGSVSVGQIARTVILYRPSPTKLKAEEKKKQESQR